MLLVAPGLTTRSGRTLRTGLLASLRTEQGRYCSGTLETDRPNRPGCRELGVDFSHGVGCREGRRIRIHLE